MAIKVSIITVAYNSGQTISKTIESVLGQPVPPYEYIIVDGLSTDNTVEIAKSYCTAFEHENIKYYIISEKDSGIYNAMNKGISLATGDLIGMINSNDWYESITIERVSEIYENNPFDLLYADLKVITPSGNIIKKAKNSKFATTYY